MIYFDHNATSPLIPEARQAWIQAHEQWIGNPSSLHRLGTRADAALQQARHDLASFLGCDALDLVWTSGATESNNLVFHHCARTLPAQAEVWVSAIEHPSVLESARAYFPARSRFMPVSPSGVLELDWLEDNLQRQRPGLVVLMAANNETGVLQPWQQAAQLCRERDVPFFCDAVQWLGKLPARGLGECDYVSGCAHKFGGPRGIGFLKCPRRGPLTPLFHGGSQEENRRAGTENVAGALSLLVALRVREGQMAAGEHEIRRLWRESVEEELARRLPGTIVIAPRQPRLWNTLPALMPPTSCPQRWVVKLDKAGYAASTGSACASGHETTSHVMAAMGFVQAEASRVLRFSSGWGTTREQWSGLIGGLEQVFAALSDS